MATTLVVLLLVLTLALGVVLGFYYLGGVRKPVLIGLHIILGAVALEQVAMLLHGAADGSFGASARSGPWAALLIAAAMFFGLIAASLGKLARRTAEFVLVAHALVGIAGFLVFLSWVRSLTNAGG